VRLASSCSRSASRAFRSTYSPRSTEVRASPYLLKVKVAPPGTFCRARENLAVSPCRTIRCISMIDD
jgi:hypothetical protein